MATTLQIPRILQAYCGNQSELSLPGSTVREVLEAVRRRHPDLYRCLCDETGQVRRHLQLFVNQRLLLVERSPDEVPGGLDTRLMPGDVVAVFQAVSGG